MNDNFIIETVCLFFNAAITNEEMEKIKKDDEEIYEIIHQFTEKISSVNIKNYIKLYDKLNEQYPINIHQFCKFVPAEYRSELKSFLGEI